MFEQPFSIYQLEYYLLIMIRLVGVMAYAPIFGTRMVTRRARIFLALGIGLCVILARPYEPLHYTTFLEYTILVVKELVTGLMISFMSNMIFTVIVMAGHFMDTQLGFAMVSNFDPTYNTETTITSDFYSQMVMIIMLCTNMHYFIISAAVDSFEVIPLGGAVFNMDVLFVSFMNFISGYFMIALRISIPVIVVITILNTVLGVLAKTAPQMNMFVVGLQLKIFLGFAVLVVTVGFLPTITNYVYNGMVTVVTDVIKGMY